MTVIIGIKLKDKISNSLKFQEVLTKYNCDIKLRIGINNGGFFCSDDGLILIQIDSGEKEIEFEKELLDISGIELQRMIF